MKAHYIQMLVGAAKLAALKVATSATYAVTTVTVSLGLFALSAGSYWLLASVVDIGTFGAALGVTLATVASFTVMVAWMEVIPPGAAIFDAYKEAQEARWPWQSRL